MSMLNTYDDFNFMIIALFIYIFLFGFIIIIINNRKSRKLYDQQFNSIQNSNRNSNRNSNSIESAPTLKCIPRPTLINNTMQMTCS